MSLMPAAITRRVVHGLAVAMMLSGAASCRNIDSVDPSFGVQAVMRGEQTVVVTNRTREPVFTLVLGREVAMLALWATCVDATVCPPIPPGESREYPVDLSPIDGIQVTAVNVYWWHAVPASGGGLRPDSVRLEVIPL